MCHAIYSALRKALESMDSKQNRLTWNQCCDHAVEVMSLVGFEDFGSNFVRNAHQVLRDNNNKFPHPNAKKGQRRTKAYDTVESIDMKIQQQEQVVRDTFGDDTNCRQLFNSWLTKKRTDDEAKKAHSIWRTLVQLRSKRKKRAEEEAAIEEEDGKEEESGEESS